LPSTSIKIGQTESRTKENQFDSFVIAAVASNSIECVNTILKFQTLRLVYTSGFRMRFPHCISIFHKLPWLSKTKVFYKKSQRSAVNACGNQMCKLSFTDTLVFDDLPEVI